MQVWLHANRFGIWLSLSRAPGGPTVPDCGQRLALGWLGFVASHVLNKSNAQLQACVFVWRVAVSNVARRFSVWHLRVLRHPGDSSVGRASDCR